ncbi:UNVERIFIED_CONTAM: hypothetical protein GTU68_000273, partial [Idotea baltica]|nr:hypothetical protein [Idotea baltica]
VDRTKRHVAFFHPYCNAGGGGERVLWCSIQAIQMRYPETVCYVYTGDLDAAPHEIMENVRRRFDIHLNKQPIFIYLKLRWLVEAKNYPFMTLVMQSLSSMILGLEALARFHPDVFIDTMGYAFTYPVFRFIGGCDISSYTHYPTISSDMLDRVSDRFILSYIKLCYYRIFAFMYGLVGSISSVVMVNSSWTKGHITQLWRYEGDVPVVFPPCDTAKFSSLPLINDEEKNLKTIVSIGQFRPEKDYPLQLRSFQRLLE